MSSVAALLSRRKHPDVATVRRMLGAAPHRGPARDVRGHGDCVLGIASADGRDDASIATDDGLAVAFAGVLDNRDEVLGVVDGSAGGDRSPAMAVLQAFRRFGEDTPKHLRGAFSAVVTDGRRLITFRDQIGWGTLFHRDDAAGTWVANEPKQIVAGSGITREPDFEAIERIYFKDEHEQDCAIRGIARLPKGTILVSDGDRARSRAYWRPEGLLETASLSRDEVDERFHEVMAQAVRRTVTGEDVLSLSGGIDSPAIAAYAAPRHVELTGRPLTALTAVYPDTPAVDELRYVKLVVDGLDIALHTYEQRSRPLDRMCHWTQLIDGPVPTISLPQYEEHYLTARRLGARNVITGELAEFVFDMRAFLIPYFLGHHRFGALGRHLVSRRRAGVRMARLARELASAFVPRALLGLRWRDSRRGIPAWLDHRRVNRAAAESASTRARDRWARLQFGGFVGSGITTAADEVCQQVCGVRTRRPWADVDVWEFFLSLPAELKFADPRSKALLRELLRGRVPDAILDRRDKTLFDDSIMARIDYDELRHWLAAPAHRMSGVDYDALGERLDRQDLGVADFMWAKDLAMVEAFLSSW